MERPYRILEHTADVALEATGQTMTEALANTALALFSVMVDLRGVRVRQWTEVEVHSTTPEDLLVDWLNELLYHSETREVLFRRFEMRGLTEAPPGRRLRARCGGEPIDPSRHHLKLPVKAVTYHQARVRRRGNAFETRVIVDI